ncbi:MAG: HEAT repeat domain-containing protein [Planctomycetes bacterium]|nr:HEAT repeat domain-containing protein [Planctomycetota bacterium]
MRGSKVTLYLGLILALVALLLVQQRQRRAAEAEPSQSELAVAALAAGGAPEEIEQAHAALVEIGAPAVNDLLRALDDPETQAPEEVIRALARIGDERAAADLAGALRAHPDARARRAAAEALAELGAAQASGALFEAAGADAALQVRQAAIVALADLGEREVIPDLVVMLDETTVAELRQAANESLQVLTEEDFALDRARAEEWLAARQADGAVSSVGGKGREPGEPLRQAGATAVEILRAGADLEISLAGEIALPMNLILDVEGGSIVLELVEEEGGPVACASDVPGSGRPLARHAPARVQILGGRAAIRIPRVGQLVSGRLPAAVQVVGKGAGGEDG